METSFDAVIIGAGPAGSAAAIWLARAGWSVALVEKQAFPRRKVCGECMAASNRPLLDALGIGAAFEAAAGPTAPASPPSTARAPGAAGAQPLRTDAAPSSSPASPAPSP